MQLQQVLMNLMLNGIQAMEKTGGALTIKAIFDAFFTTKPESSGMGLAISRSIIESHGGRVWATVNSGSGATFHITLPAADSELDVSGNHALAAVSRRNVNQLALAVIDCGAPRPARTVSSARATFSPLRAVSA